MSSDQVARLAATIEVLTGAVHFLVAERVASQPAAVQGELLHILQRALSAPPRSEDSLTRRAALAQADLALWMPIVAGGVVDEVRRQLGRAAEGIPRIPPGRVGASSEVAERTLREHARGAVAHFEGGRAVA